MKNDETPTWRLLLDQFLDAENRPRALTAVEADRVITALVAGCFELEIMAEDEDCTHDVRPLQKRVEDALRGKFKFKSRKREKK